MLRYLYKFRLSVRLPNSLYSNNIGSHHSIISIEGQYETFAILWCTHFVAEAFQAMVSIRSSLKYTIGVYLVLCTLLCSVCDKQSAQIYMQ